MHDKVVQLNTYRDDLLPLATRFGEIQEEQDAPYEPYQPETLSIKENILNKISSIFRKINLKQSPVKSSPIETVEVPEKETISNVHLFPKIPDFIRIIENFMFGAENHFQQLCMLVDGLQNNPHIMDHAEDNQHLKHYMQETFNHCITCLSYDQLKVFYHEISHVALTTKRSLFSHLVDICQAHLTNTAAQAYTNHARSRSAIK